MIKPPFSCFNLLTSLTKMNIRYISLLILFLSVLTASADKKMTVRNSETGESFEVSVPDGLKIYEYNSNWLDSVPYLIARAKYGEPWAYEALGDCYRYGKGGVEQSLCKAFVYYGLSGTNVEEMAMNTVKENPKDHLGLVLRLIDKIEGCDNEGILCVLDTLNQNKYFEADILRRFIIDLDTLSLLPVIERNIRTPEVSTDRMIFTLAGCRICDWYPKSIINRENLSLAFASKLPFIFDKIAVESLSDNHEVIDSEKLVEKRKKAIALLKNADKYAMLSREGAKILYKHYMSEQEAGGMILNEDEMERLAILARLPESETFIFRDK